MTLVAASRVKRRRWDVFPLVWLLAGVVFAAVGLRLANHDFVSADLAALWTARGAATDGVWLSSLLLEALAWLPDVYAQALLSLVSGVAAGFGAALLLVNLRRNEWPFWQAALVVALLASNALILYAVTAAHGAIPLIFACALMIPFIRRLESVGDVQAEMGFGLVLPLFLLAGPATAPLVPLLAVMSALTDPTARRDWRAFIAMFLVAILPSLIVLAGLLTINFHHGRTLQDFLAPYLALYGREHVAYGIDALLNLAIFAPVALVPIIYCLAPDRRMKPLSALAVIALPLFLALARALFGWDVAAWAPAAALLGGFCAWLAVSRLSRNFRLAAIALMLVSAASGWTLQQLWAAPDWTQGLRGEARSLGCGAEGRTSMPCDPLRGRLSADVSEARVG